ncbi:TonB-dependent receptor domain-containing protein [Alishewanella tabrizica]|uniref:TonB-dependent receptor n=1 Tax=Alishewanella tabrizica TaxID=671278 RepID=A0ABQ2WJU5_9ALTE|nr:TonB-dependent receptor [Alishewanella tabrizica]GGW59985.1 TonB-dependent receptor [Alishewanella tabrizica]
MKHSTRSPLALAIGGLLAGSVFTVIGQDTSQQSEQTAEKAPERISVLGSRIRTDGLDRASPVEVLSADTAISQGLSTLGDLLRSSTVAAGSNQITSATSSAISEGGIGVETVSLRGLGANRTLILLNGRRIGPAGTRGAVSAFDLNIMPLAAVDRVEILKDGASSLYGSDAVAGVVNIITKKGDESVVNVNISQPTKEGGETVRLSASFGRTFDRGSVRVVADYRKDSELARGDRRFFDCAEAYYFDTANGARKDVIDPRTGSFHCNDLPAGHVWVYDYAYAAEDGSTNVPNGGGASTLMQYDYDGSLSRFLPPFTADANNPAHLRVPQGWYPVSYSRESAGLTNASHPFQSLTTLVPERDTKTVFAQGDYALNDAASLYAEALFNRRETISNGYRQFWNLFHYTNDGAGVLPNSTLSPGWTGAQGLSSTPITDHDQDIITVDYRRFVIGAEGSLGQWNWDLNFQSSRSDGDYFSKVIFNDSIASQQFITESCVGSTTAVRNVPCIDLPWLDPNFLNGQFSPEQRAFLFGDETGNTIYKQQTLEAVISGNVFELPAGTVGAAFGAQHQRDEILDTPGSVTLARNAWGSSSAGVTAGKSTTKAIFSEIQLPILRDLTLVDRLDLELSARYTDVSTSGSDSTYKVGINWDLGGGLRIRGSQGTSFRSPALYELYLNDQESFPRIADPCANWATALQNGRITQLVADNCAAEGIAPDFRPPATSNNAFAGGGLGELVAETSTARTVGFVYTPEWTKFSMSADYFDIEIDGEVTQLTAGQVVSGCYNSTEFSTEPLCNLFNRDNLGRVENIRLNFLNIATQYNRGFDLIFNYDIDTNFGTFFANYNHTIQIEAAQQLLASSPRENRAGWLGRPRHVGNLNLGWTQGDLSINWSTRYVGESSLQDRYRQLNGKDTITYWEEEVDIQLSTPSTFYHSLSGTYDFKKYGVTVTAGVSNLFDKEPPKLSNVPNYTSRIGTSAFYSQYDFIGRRMFLDVTYSF